MSGLSRVSVAPGHLIVSDIKDARDELLRRGVGISEVFHDAGSGENTRRGRPRFHQATMVAKTAATIAATPCAVDHGGLVQILTLTGRLAE